MENNRDPKRKAVASLILGIIGIIIWYLSPILIPKLSLLSIAIRPLFFLITYITGFLLPIIGLVFGILGLKSSRKSIAIAGIVICALFLADIIIRRFEVLIFIFLAIAKIFH